MDEIKHLPSANLENDGANSLARSDGNTCSTEHNESSLLRSPATARRTGSFGKGARKITTPHGPLLATEARSLVRPCNCGKDGVFNKNHHHVQNHHHHKVPPSPERVRREYNGAPKSPQVARKPRIQNPPEKKDSSKDLLKKAPTTATLQQKLVPNRFVSTVVWYPELQPEFNFTTLRLSPGEDSMKYIDEILITEYDNYIKKMFPNDDHSKNKENMEYEEKGKNTFTNFVMQKDNFVSVS